MFFSSRTTAVAFRSTVLLLFAAVVARPAAITVGSTATNIGGGEYQYAYTITYTGTDDAFLVDISVPSLPSAITNLTVPAGFNDQFDSVNGLVSFLENTSTFTAVPTSGFSFDSPYAPGTSTFVASLFDSSFDIYTISGSTVAPVLAAMTVAPEPSYLYLLLFMAAACFFFNRRKTGNTSLVPETINHTETTYVRNN